MSNLRKPLDADARPANPSARQHISWRLRYPPHYIHPSELRNRRWYRRAKVLLDYGTTLLLLLPALPLIALSALLVRITSQGPAFYVQVRLGRNGRPYRLFKIRTMFKDCERLTGPRWAAPGDPRITRVGHFLRKAHLDELPQLFNVLLGQMSLVGPRPERPEMVPALEQSLPGYWQRLQVRPGITGLAQVQLPADTDIASVRRKLSYDMYYVRRFSLWLDLRLIACTAFKCFGMSFRTQRRLFALPEPDQVEKISRIPLEVPPVRELQHV